MPDGDWPRSAALKERGEGSSARGDRCVDLRAGGACGRCHHGRSEERQGEERRDQPGARDGTELGLDRLVVRGDFEERVFEVDGVVEHGRRLDGLHLDILPCGPDWRRRHDLGGGARRHLVGVGDDLVET